MTRRTWRARFALLGVAALALSACSSNASPATSGGSGSATKVQVYSWWTSGDEAAGLNKLIDQFNLANPQLQIINQAVVGGPGTTAKAILKTHVLGGDPPDSFQVHMGHELIDTWVTTGYMQNLDDVYAANGWKDKFPPGLLDILSYDSHFWSVPVDIQRGNVLWYNRKLFAANGLKPPETWDQFKTVADKLKAKGIIPLALGDKVPFASGQLFETILIGTLGADRYKGLWTGTTDWKGADINRALTTFRTVLNYVNPDHASLTWDQANDLLISGKAAMTVMVDWIDGDYAAKNFKDYGWAPAPGNKGIYDALSDSFGLPKGAKHPEAAKKFLTLLGSAEGQDLFNPLKGSIPARTDAGKPIASAKQYDDYLKSAMAEWKTDAIVPSLEHGAAAKESWSSAFTQAVVTFVTNQDVATAQTALAKACVDAKVCK